MTRRITRAKQAIADSGVPFAPPSASERGPRLAAVRHVLYLIFTEGYAATSGLGLLRPDLCAEAIRLTRLLHRLLPDETETAGLLALMLLTDARRAARTDPHGRSLIPHGRAGPQPWDLTAISEGVALHHRRAAPPPAWAVPGAGRDRRRARRSRQRRDHRLAADPRAVRAAPAVLGQTP